MDIETIRSFCLGLPGVDESFPFDSETLVFKVGGKMFALLSLEGRDFDLSLKMDPAESKRVRDIHEDVQPAYHMNKKHWIGVRTRGAISSNQIMGWIKGSHELVLAGLPKKEQARIRP